MIVPIGIESIRNAVLHVSSLRLRDRVTLCERIHERQPHAFLALLALSQDGVTMEAVDHAIHLLMVMHTAFETTCTKKLPIITKSMIDEAFRDNATVFRAYEQNLISLDNTIESHPEQTMLTYLVGYLRDNDLAEPSEPNERLIMTIKVILDTFATARSIAEPRDEI
jgi:hypothetical protein